MGLSDPQLKNIFNFNVEQQRWIAQFQVFLYYDRINGIFKNELIILSKNTTIRYCMSTSQTLSFSCYTCTASFKTDDLYKQHYKSEYHRYNLKRKMINLAPICYLQYQEQFQINKSNSSTAADFKCETCNKVFFSSNTYSDHLNSKKHRQNRMKNQKKLQIQTIQKVKSQQSLEFSILSFSQKEDFQKCFFCSCQMSDQHLKLHNFPPFKYNCNDLPGLMRCVQNIVNECRCLFCRASFCSIQSAKQHMYDLGHSRINTEYFSEFQEFYDWSIKQEQNQNEDDWQIIEEQSTNLNVTLQDLQKRRRERMVFTDIGVKINGKLVGLRAYKRYYSQYFRPVVPIQRVKALTNYYQEATLQLKTKYKNNRR